MKIAEENIKESKKIKRNYSGNIMICIDNIALVAFANNLSVDQKFNLCTCNIILDNIAKSGMNKPSTSVVTTFESYNLKILERALSSSQHKKKLKIKSKSAAGILCFGFNIIN